MPFTSEQIYNIHLDFLDVCFGPNSGCVNNLGDLELPGLILNWLYDNNINTIHYSVILDDYLIAYEYLGMDARVFLNSIYEDAVMAYQPKTTIDGMVQEYETIISFKDLKWLDKLRSDCNDPGVIATYQIPSVEGPASVLAKNYHSIKPAGEWVMIDIDTYNKIDLPNGMMIVAREVDKINLVFNRIIEWGQHERRVLIGPFESRSEALLFKLSV